jgi:hypothetical protein
MRPRLSRVLVLCLVTGLLGPLLLVWARLFRPEGLMHTRHPLVVGFILGALTSVSLRARLAPVEGQVQPRRPPDLPATSGHASGPKPLWISFSRPMTPSAAAS